MIINLKLARVVSQESYHSLCIFDETCDMISSADQQVYVSLLCESRGHGTAWEEEFQIHLRWRQLLDSSSLEWFHATKHAAKLLNSACPTLANKMKHSLHHEKRASTVCQLIWREIFESSVCVCQHIPRKQQISRDDTDSVRMTGVRFVTPRTPWEGIFEKHLLVSFLTCLQKISASACEGQLCSFEKLWRQRTFFQSSFPETILQDRHAGQREWNFYSVTHSFVNKMTVATWDCITCTLELVR